MQCSVCGAINPAQAHFCMGCGSRLVAGIVCSACHTLLPLQANYCYHCGTFVAQAQLAAPPALHYAPLPPAQAVPAQPPAFQPPAAQTPSFQSPAPQATAPQPVPAPPPAVQAPASPKATLNQLPAPQPLNEMLPALRRYLPAEIYEPLERRPRDKDLAATRDHLSALLSTLKTYLPHPVITAPQPPGVPAGGMYRGVFIFGDVSGFTPLSEKLKARGQAGAEQIVNIINALFTQLVKALFLHGGTLLKFGGDAMLGLFPATTDEEMRAAVLRAAQTAQVMQEVLKRPEFAEIDAMGEKRTLLIKCGISAGAYFAAHIGTPPNEYRNNGTMAYVTTGETVNQAEEAEGHAHPGQIAMTKQAAELLGELAQLAAVEREPDENYRRLVEAPKLEAGENLSLDVAEPPQGDVLAQITYLVERLNRLTPYLADELVSRVVTNPNDARITPEHRPVTVMFANYKGISKLIEKHGEQEPELIIQHLNNYFVHMASIVEKYEGTLARMDQYAVGDRIVIFFGAPRAHEDDPVRAVYTALEMQEAVRENFAALRTSSGVFRFEQRIGINTGHLFAGNAGAPDLRQEYTLMGDDINMAARLMSNAGWGQIFISKKTKEYVAAFIEVEDRGELKVKGKEIRIPTFAALGRRGEVGRTRGLDSGESPLTGRDAQLKTILERGETFLKGRGQIVSIMGNSGLGKSRLLSELQRRLKVQPQAQNVQWIESRALSFSEQTSYWMAAQMMRSLLGISPNARQDDVLYALSERAESLMAEQAMDATPYLAHMMGLDLGEEWAWVKKEDPKVRQKQTLWAASALIVQIAKDHPLVIALDDLHWADEASLALFEHLLKVSDQADILLILIFRAMRDKGCWKLRDRASSDYPHRYTEIELQPLTLEQSGELLGKLLPGAEFEPERKQEILEKAAGNPFYLEEVVRTLLEGQGVIPDPENAGHWIVSENISKLAVPASLHAAIVARIDRLTEDARLALQTASVLGRQFRLELLRDLSKAHLEIELWLAQLERGGLLRPSAGEDEIYAFPDTLVQEVAYESLLVTSRQQLHKQIGEMLETVHQAELEQHAELLAYHFSRSDDNERALKYLQIATRRSEERYANATAIQYYQRILKIQRERGDKPGQAAALYSMGVKAYELGDFDEARTWLAEAVALRQELQDAPNEGWGVMYLGMVDLKQGRYLESSGRHQYALDQARLRGDRFQEGIHLTNLARVRMRMGYYQQALEYFNASLELKRANKDLTGQGFSLFYLGLVSVYEEQNEHAAEYLAQSVEMWKQVQQNERGLAYCEQGLGLLALNRRQAGEAVEYFQQAIARCEKLVLKAELIENLSYLGQALLAGGKLEEARVHSVRAIKLLREQKDVEEEQAIYFNHYRVLKANHEAQAGEFLHQAQDSMQAQAELLNDPEERRSFLEQVRINRWIQNEK